MPDGRKNNKGVLGNKGGRKPKLDEISKIEMMDILIDPIGAWGMLLKKCEEGDVTAIRFWVEQRFGKAKESKDISITDETIKQFIIKGAKGNTGK